MVAVLLDAASGDENEARHLSLLCANHFCLSEEVFIQKVKKEAVERHHRSKHNVILLLHLIRVT